ncbi:hypothetical protein MAR_032739 [Mya arenaria]|uniref:Uncharacterized protein n=1 Tax=Mya arenaria TaxID=6604 RepID=A0ABY7F865_MYAAR|nr:uncharacterized protein LOC128205703 [Mya arenaria]WAR18145.1 hypothetical protein MAR_032739 [Mya arenaria]
MCRWGCTTTNTTYMCKWCGTRYCRECLRGDFLGLMPEPTHCRICNQKRCQGNRIEYVPRSKDEVDPKAQKSKSATGMRTRSAAASAKSSRSVKSARGKSGKKSGKKKKK